MEIKEQNLSDENQTKTTDTETNSNVSKYSVFANETADQLANNASFLREASNDVNAVLAHLPTEKFLKQEFTEGATNALYQQVIDKIFSPIDMVEVGKGVEYCLTNGVSVSNLDEGAFVPSAPSDPTAATYWTSISLPDQIKQSTMTGQPWKYFSYFLSGKVDQMINLVVDRAREAIDLSMYYDCFNLLKTIFKTTYAKPASTTAAPTNHVVGTATYLLDATREIKDLVYSMMNHNNIYQYSSDWGGYNNLRDGDQVFITTNQVYNNLTKYATTFLNDEELTKFADLKNWVIVPEKMFNPQTNTLEELKIMWNADDSARVPGAILIVSRNGLKRIYNLRNAFSEFYPNNMATQYWFNARYTQGILPWCQVAVYENPVLEQDFYVPTEQKQ